jgi:hypothetical protein
MLFPVEQLDQDSRRAKRVHLVGRMIDRFPLVSENGLSHEVGRAGLEPATTRVWAWRSRLGRPAKTKGFRGMTQVLRRRDYQGKSTER